MKHLIVMAYAHFNNGLRGLFMFTNATMPVLYLPGINKLRNFNSKVRAYHQYRRAINKVPAYQDFLRKQNFKGITFSGFVPNIHEIPFTDKENYVKKYSMEERCVGGRIPDHNVVIDESSGSSGTATNWARGGKERSINAKFIKFGMLHMFGKTPLFIINAFALGPWATGVNVTMSCVPFSKLKSLGPDKIKIVNTLKQFGPSHKYIIMGYPPFLKMLVESTEIDWMKYDVSLIFGGEAMSEGMRDFLLSRGIKKVLSSLGASDLELNISAENDFTISLRRLLRDNETLRSKMLKHKGALPMIFQYNPSDFLIETNEKGELIITVCRAHYIAPKIRYNIHDLGHTMSLEEVYHALDELGIARDLLSTPPVDLPILLHYGRSDMTVAFFGSNISPGDIQEALFSMPDFAALINSYCINVDEDLQGGKSLVVSLELLENTQVDDRHSSALVKMEFFDHLAKMNQDFREARKMISNEEQCRFEFHQFGQGPFADNDIRIKLKYIR